MQLPPNLYGLQHSLTQPKVSSIAVGTGRVAALESDEGGRMEVLMFDEHWTWIILWAIPRSRAKRTLNSWTSDRLFKISLYWHSLPQDRSTAFENNFRISSPSQPAIHQNIHTYTHIQAQSVFSRKGSTTTYTRNVRTRCRTGLKASSYVVFTFLNETKSLFVNSTVTYDCSNDHSLVQLIQRSPQHGYRFPFHSQALHHYIYHPFQIQNKKATVISKKCEK